MKSCISTSSEVTHIFCIPKKCAELFFFLSAIGHLTVRVFSKYLIPTLEPLSNKNKILIENLNML